MPNNKANQLKKTKCKVLFSLVIFEVIIIILSLIGIISEINNYKDRFGQVMIAPSFGEIITGLKMFNIFYIIVLVLGILPGIFFYQYFIGSKSIYTMLRLPGKYSRLNFYLNQVKFSIKGIIEVWLIQLILIFVLYLLYIIVIPKVSLPGDVWGNLWRTDYIIKLFPFTKPLYFIPLVFIPILLANISILLVLVERSRKRSILAVFGLIISVFGIYSLNINSSHSIWVLPIITFLSMAISIFYIYRVEIV